MGGDEKTTPLLIEKKKNNGIFPFANLQADAKLLSGIIGAEKQRRRAESFDVMNSVLQKSGSPDKEKVIKPVVLIKNSPIEE